jgi:hypothetical protein
MGKQSILPLKNILLFLSNIILNIMTKAVFFQKGQTSSMCVCTGIYTTDIRSTPDIKDFKNYLPHRGNRWDVFINNLFNIIFHQLSSQQLYWFFKKR